MENLLIRKDDFNGFIGRVASDYRVYGPVAEEGGAHFGELAGRPVDLAFKNTKNAPKNLLFRHTETLARFTRTPKGMEYQADGDAVAPSVAIMRPCDAGALAFLDKVFGWAPCDDPYYISRREKTIIISLGCKSAPYAACFCGSVGGEPQSERGADIFVTEMGDHYLVRFLNEKGAALEKYAQGAKKAEPGDLALLDEARKAAAATLKSTVPAAEIQPVLKANFENPFWETLHGRCLACGTCTFLCPTCHCFDINDEVKGEGGVRLRSWDSCMFWLFTKETSGHNPRPSQRERWRQRVMHKFSYIPENFDETGCVGCGRCVINCPVNLDIRKIVEDISKL